MNDAAPPSIGPIKVGAGLNSSPGLRSRLLRVIEAVKSHARAFRSGFLSRKALRQVRAKGEPIAVPEQMALDFNRLQTRYGLANTAVPAKVPARVAA